MIEAGLYSYLTSRGEITSLVGQRVYPQIAEQGAAYPRVVFHRRSTEREHTEEGPSGMARVEIEVSYWGGVGPAAYLLAKKCAAAGVKLLDGFRGKMGDYKVPWCVVQDEYDDFEPPEFADEGYAQGVTQVIQLDYYEGG